jgi:hypothetical protein
VVVLVVVDELDDAPYAVACVIEEWQLSKILQRQVQGMSSAVHPCDVRVSAIRHESLSLKKARLAFIVNEGTYARKSALG